jgi:hypothetical protein
LSGAVVFTEFEQTGGFQVMRSKHSSRAFSLLVFLPLLFRPAALNGQSAQQNAVPLKNWAAPLYWQPNQAERETAAKAGTGIQPFATQLSTGALTFVAVTPCRLVDTRGAAAGFNGLSPFSGPSFVASSTVTFPVQSAAEAAADTTPSPCGTIPSIAQAYSFNITVIPKTAGGIGFVSIWPSGGAQPAVSTINDGSGQILANAAIVPAGGPSGGVSVFNSGPAAMDLIIDMNGYYAVTGDIAGVTAGTDLTGGGVGGTVTLNLDTSKVPTLAGSNTFTGSGNFFLGGSVGIGTATPVTTLEVNGPAQVDGSIYLNGNIIDGGNIIYQQPYGSSTNTALGVGSFGGSDSSGTGNTASGYCAMNGNPAGCGSGSGNARPMPRALRPQDRGDNPHPDIGSPGGTTTGSYNTAHGYQALSSINGGTFHTATGAQALYSNQYGQGDTAIGANALYSLTGTSSCCAGSYNTAVGFNAGYNISTGINNIAIGWFSGGGITTGNDNIDIGYDLGNAPNESGVTRIGLDQTAFYASGIGNATVSGVPVLVNTSTGQLGVASSSLRFKEDIHDMADGSDGLMRLRPVTFRYKQPFDDGTKPIQYGLIAEEVAEVYPDLVARSADGQIETVKYQLLDPMLLNEVQKQYQHAQEQDETIRRQQELVLQQQEQALRQQDQIKSLESRLAALEALLSGKVRSATSAGQ